MRTPVCPYFMYVKFYTFGIWIKKYYIFVMLLRIFCKMFLILFQIFWQLKKRKKVESKEWRLKLCFMKIMSFSYNFVRCRNFQLFIKNRKYLTFSFYFTFSFTVWIVYIMRIYLFFKIMRSKWILPFVVNKISRYLIRNWKKNNYLKFFIWT